jgi:hypothetical protein
MLELQKDAKRQSQVRERGFKNIEINLNMKKLIIDIRKLEKFVSKRKVAFVTSIDDERYTKTHV